MKIIVAGGARFIGSMRVSLLISSCLRIRSTL